MVNPYSLTRKNNIIVGDSVFRFDKVLHSNLIGINFHGYGSSMSQNRSTLPPPKNYIEDSFKIFVENRITCIRVTLYWESYEHDTDLFDADLNEISKMANRYGITCIYDNHQWECSSWIGCGIGMPILLYC